jgi:hypothetical protein
MSANKFSNGANQNSGNVLTDRPTTRLNQAPGGTSTLILGSDAELIKKTSAEQAGDENVDTTNFATSVGNGKAPLKPSAGLHPLQSTAGTTAVLLG